MHDNDEIEFNRMLSKCRGAAAGGWSVQSSGEKLAAALALNRADWLASMDYTIAEAIERIGPQWLRLLPRVARALKEES